MRSPARLIACAGAGFVTGLTALATPANAYIDHPWCTGGGGWAGALTCSFDSYEQCRMNARSCVANPAVTPLPRVQSRTGPGCATLVCRKLASCPRTSRRLPDTTRSKSVVPISDKMQTT
jgi:Protein of unknown function (DUF3551)